VTDRRRLRLADEDGQSLVMMVAFLLGIVLMLALVVNVGFWLQSKRRAQTVADSVALAVASVVPSSGCSPAVGTQGIANCYADKNWPGFTDDGTVTVDPPAGTSITVHVRHSVPGFFTSLIGEAFGTVTVGAHATAAVLAPATLDNQKLNAITQTPTYVAPIVVTDDACQTPPWTTCLGAVRTLTLDQRNPDASTFNVVDLSCAAESGACLNPSATTLASWIKCGPCLDGVLGIGDDVPAVATNVLDTCPGTGRNGRQNPKCAIRDALASPSVAGNTIMVAVSDSVVGNRYHVSGYAAFAITSVRTTDRQWRDRPTKSIVGLFLSFTPAATLDTSGVAPAFGVQTVGLTG
jgi:hypothetical protein